MYIHWIWWSLLYPAPLLVFFLAQPPNTHNTLAKDHWLTWEQRESKNETTTSLQPSIPHVHLVINVEEWLMNIVFFLIPVEAYEKYTRFLTLCTDKHQLLKREYLTAALIQSHLLTMCSISMGWSWLSGYICADLNGGVWLWLKASDKIELRAKPVWDTTVSLYLGIAQLTTFEQQ